MTQDYIKKYIKRHSKKDWYYYYSFDGLEVRPELKNTLDCGLNNWDKISKYVFRILDKYENPKVLDIGCNMGLYDYEMEKYGAEVTGVDLSTDHALFFQRYVRENLNSSFNANFLRIDVTKTKVPLDSVDVVCLFCVIYHLSPHEDGVIESLPKHKHIIIQGNKPRERSKKRGYQKLAGVKGIVELLHKHGYKPKVYDWEDYSKPLVIGEKS